MQRSGLCWPSGRSIAGWFLEKLLVFVTGGLLTLTFRRFRFSNFSYALLAVFLSLHALGAHYTYVQVPAGFWLRDLTTPQ